MVGEDGMDLDGGEESKSRESEKKSNPNPERGPVEIEPVEIEEGEGEEVRMIRGPKAIYTPSKEEWDNHMRSHIPFRKWCPFCLKGRSKLFKLKPGHLPKNIDVVFFCNRQLVSYPAYLLSYDKTCMVSS